MEEDNDNLIIHDECGLDIELCICPDSKFYWDSENDCIKERPQNETDNH